MSHGYVTEGVGAFMAVHPVFRYADLVASTPAANRRTRDALLRHYEDRGRLLRVRRGLYVSVPPGAKPDTCPLDPYLLSARMTDDAVLAYHTALEFHGKAHSTHGRFYYLTARASRALSLRSLHFRAVRFPSTLRTSRERLFGARNAERAGLTVRVTTLERTLVDVLDRPDLGGGWEEIWRSLESVEFFDLDLVIEYTLLLENATTAAKVGFFLDEHREPLMVEERHFDRLRKRRPRRPHYMARGKRTGGRFVSAWNLVVPAGVLERSWQEVT